MDLSPETVLQHQLQIEAQVQAHGLEITSILVNVFDKVIIHAGHKSQPPKRLKQCIKIYVIINKHLLAGTIKPTGESWFCSINHHLQQPISADLKLMFKDRGPELETVHTTLPASLTWLKKQLHKFKIQ